MLIIDQRLFGRTYGPAYLTYQRRVKSLIPLIY